MEPPAPETSAGPRNVQQDTDPCRMATLGDRFVAFVLDSLVLFGVFIVVDAWVFMRWGSVEGWELRLSAASLLLVGTLNGTIFFLYLWLLEAGFGATLGKAMVGIRVVRTSDSNPLAALAVRNLFRMVDGLGFYLVGALVAGCSTLRRRVGDICAGTAVIEEEFGLGVKFLSVLLWAAVLAGAAWAVPRICAKDVAHRPRYLNQTVVQVGRTEHSAYFKVARLKIDVQFASDASR
jgi:uncharacterized RDD family membrane protein YckC